MNRTAGPFVPGLPASPSVVPGPDVGGLPIPGVQSSFLVFTPVEAGDRACPGRSEAQGPVDELSRTRRRPGDGPWTGCPRPPGRPASCTGRGLRVHMPTGGCPRLSTGFSTSCVRRTATPGRASSTELSPCCARSVVDRRRDCWSWILSDTGRCPQPGVGAGGGTVRRRACGSAPATSRGLRTCCSGRRPGEDDRPVGRVRCVSDRGTGSPALRGVRPYWGDQPRDVCLMRFVSSVTWL